MDKVIISILILTSSLTFGQATKGTKREKAINTIIGTWVFKDGKIKDNQFGDIKVERWHTDTIYFFFNMTIKFYSHDSMNGDIRRNEGLWDITENGKIIILKDRQITPPFDEPVTNLQLPIKLKPNQLVVMYPVTLQNDDSVKDKSNSSSTGQKRAEINYIRVK